jgi:hypothetical protein
MILLGSWRLLRADAALDFAPEVRMEFREGGILRYTFAVGEGRQGIDLRYATVGDVLRTEVPGTTHETTARFEFGKGDVLILDFAGARAWFVRELVPTPHGTG